MPKKKAVAVPVIIDELPVNDRDFKHIMVDLETLGQKPGCSILSIGAVAFNERCLGPTFYSVLNRQTCLELGLEEEIGTVSWWSGQSAEAKKVLEAAALPEAPAAKSALTAFANFIKRFGSGTVKIWGNGASFDNAILSVAYGRAKMELPWAYWNDRCYRTWKAQSAIKLNRVGTYHNALDDAISQANHALEIIKSGVKIA